MVKRAAHNGQDVGSIPARLKQTIKPLYELRYGTKGY